MFEKMIALLIYYLVRLLSLTYRVEVSGAENKQKAKALHPQNIFSYALWHQNLVAALFTNTNERYTIVISDSKDGEIAAVACKRRGHLLARGSSTRGGKKAFIAILNNMKRGYPAAITVDGPKGPAHIVKNGIIEIAKLSHCAIVPLTPYPLKCWVFKKSWDQLKIPKPFTKIIVVIGEPLFIEENTTRNDFPKISQMIKERLESGEELAKNILLKSI